MQETVLKNTEIFDKEQKATNIFFFVSEMDYNCYNICTKCQLIFVKYTSAN